MNIPFPQLIPIGQALIALGAAKLITRGNADVALINTRAQTALAIAAVANDISTGDVADAQTAFNGVLGDPKMDPVVATELKALAGGVIQEAMIAANIGKLQVGFSALAQAALTDFVGGLTFAANGEIAAHPLPTGGSTGQTATDSTKVG